MLGYITETIPSNIVIETLSEKGNFSNLTTDIQSNMFDLLMEGFALHKIIFDKDHKPYDAILMDVNKSFEEITSIKKEQILGSRLREFFPNYLGVLDIWINIFSEVALDGKVISFKTYSSKLNMQFKVNAFSPKYGEFAVFFNKYSENKKAKVSMPHMNNVIKPGWKFLAYHDPLTTLPNRRFLVEKLNEELYLAEKSSYTFAIMFIDIDNFKTINDSLGHEVGDYVLKEFSFRLKNNIRKNDTVFRLGGDEFIIFLKVQNGLDDIINIADRIVKSLHIPFRYENKEILLTSSIGISVYPEDGNNINTLLKHADKAMYDAKKQCGNYFKFFNSSVYNEMSIS